MEEKSIKIMFTGDSVTDCGRLRPLGDGISEVGSGYVSDLCLHAWADHPGHRVRFQNSAVAGDTTKKLLARFDTDIIAYRPDYLFIMIGINDCIRFFDENTVKTEYQIAPEQSADNVAEMLRRAKAAGIVPVLVSPLYFDLFKSGIRARRDDLDKRYREKAEKEGVAYLDVQRSVDAYMRKCGDYLLSQDRIHPKPIGAMLIANAFRAFPLYRSLFR